MTALALRQKNTIRWRRIVVPEDPPRIRALVAAARVFSAEEAEVAADLVAGTVDGTDVYRFVFAERGGEIIGYTCFEKIPLSKLSFDLFWIAVAPEQRGTGLAHRLIAKTAAEVRRKGGRFLFAETSSRDPYAPARAFYRKAGFEEGARFSDFYEDGDDKLIYRLVL
jgi:ribosomal protein S18 acetylase RimI-like enzyme